MSLLKIIEKLGTIPYPNTSSKKRIVYKVECSCGTIKLITADNFHKVKSCGCLNSIAIPLGMEFERLTIIEDLGVGILDNTNTKTRNVKCICKCGNEVKAQWSNIKYGNVRSCGCLQSEISRANAMTMQELNIKHGDAIKGSELNRLYAVWCRIRNRCYNKNHGKYKWYGGAGIQVCDEWLDSYLSFKEWALSNGYTDELTIDRKDVMGNYEPNNCQWLTAQENIEKQYSIDRETRRKNNG